MIQLLKIWLGISFVMAIQRTTSAISTSQEIGVLAVLDLTHPELPYNERIGLAIDKWRKTEPKCTRGDFWYNGKCHVLNLESELCAKDTEILVLEKPKEQGDKFPFKPICKKVDCDSVSLWWPSLKRCVGILEAKEICGKQGEVLFDIFYDSYCECKPGSGNLYEDGKCHIFNSQGPCKDGEVFKPKGDQLTTLGECDPKV